MKRLILVEGLPGTGKTTISEWLSNLLAEQGETAILLREGDARIPCDFYEMAGIPKDEFELLCSSNPSERKFLLDTALQTENYSFLRIDKCPDHIAEKIRRWDMGDERNQAVTAADYVPCALERLRNWVDANIENSDTVIIDSGYLQNPVNELLFRHASDMEVKSFITNISSLLLPLNACCVYLKRDSAQEAIRFAKEAKGMGWANGVDELLRQAGLTDFFSHRFALEQELLYLLPHIVCEIEGDCWEPAKEKLKAYFHSYQVRRANMNITIKPLMPELSADYFDFFENRAFTDDSPYRCYCQAFQMTKEQEKAEYEKVDGPDIGLAARKVAERQINSGILRGYLAFVDGVSIGWCNANDKANFPIESCTGARFHAPAEKREKAVVCFEIAPEFRGKGVATALLKQVVADATAEGYLAVEGFPVVHDERFEWDYTGPIRLYEKLGFVKVAEQDKSVVMRKELR